MRSDIPGRLELAIIRASEIEDGAEEQEQETPQNDFREDSPFAQSKPETDETTIEDSVQWLHDQGYTFSEIYKLLIGEINVLSEGYERKQEREKEQQESGTGGSRTETSYGNKGDRAAELGWR